jgi:hypothetical protein
VGARSAQRRRIPAHERAGALRLPLIAGATAQFAALAALALGLGCTRTEDAPSEAAVRVELVNMTPGTFGTYAADAVYRVVNDGDQPIAYWGSSVDGEPCVRLAILTEGRWLEHTPVWIKCATGLEVRTLAAGAEVRLEVRVQRPDLPMRLGVGWWEPREGDHPPWMEWTWVWSPGERLEEQGAPAVH